MLHDPRLSRTIAREDNNAVVLDLGMPEMDGLAARRRLRQLVPKLPMALFSIDTSSHLENAAQAKRRSSGIFENTVESTPVVAGSSAG
jgi:CheY-like chemotaxis protein